MLTIMKTIKVQTYLLGTASAMALAVTANAGFINGGFETGDFTGWTLEHGANEGGPGTITWTATIADQDPDLDTATVTSTIVK